MSPSHMTRATRGSPRAMGYMSCAVDGSYPSGTNRFMLARKVLNEQSSADTTDKFVVKLYRLCLFTRYTSSSVYIGTQLRNPYITNYLAFSYYRVVHAYATKCTNNTLKLGSHTATEEKMKKKRAKFSALWKQNLHLKNLVNVQPKAATL